MTAHAKAVLKQFQRLLLREQDGQHSINPALHHMEDFLLQAPLVDTHLTAERRAFHSVGRYIHLLFHIQPVPRNDD
jgi:hypothetical protein